MLSVLLCVGRLGAMSLNPALFCGDIPTQMPAPLQVWVTASSLFASRQSARRYCRGRSAAREATTYLLQRVRVLLLPLGESSKGRKMGKKRSRTRELFRTFGSLGGCSAAPAAPPGARHQQRLPSQAALGSPRFHFYSIGQIPAERRAQHDASFRLCGGTSGSRCFFHRGQSSAVAGWSVVLAVSFRKPVLRPPVVVVAGCCCLRFCLRCGWCSG